VVISGRLVATVKISLYFEITGARTSVILYVATLRTRRNNNYYLYGVGVNSYYNILLLLWCYNNNISYTLYDTRHCFHHCAYFGGNDGLKETHTSTTVVVVRNRRTKINEKITLVPAFDFILCKPNNRNRPIFELESRNGCRVLLRCLLIYEVFAWDISAWNSILEINMSYNTGKNDPWKREYRLQSKNRKRKKIYEKSLIRALQVCASIILYLFYIKLKQIF